MSEVVGQSFESLMDGMEKEVAIIDKFAPAALLKLSNGGQADRVFSKGNGEAQQKLLVYKGNPELMASVAILATMQEDAENCIKACGLSVDTWPDAEERKKALDKALTKGRTIVVNRMCLDVILKNDKEPMINVTFPTFVRVDSG